MTTLNAGIVLPTHLIFKSGLHFPDSGIVNEIETYEIMVKQQMQRKISDCVYISLLSP
jgi:hypothetical protein